MDRKIERGDYLEGILEKIELVINYKILGIILLVSAFGFLAFRLYYKEKELRLFMEFHKKATLNITSGKNNDHYPFFKDDRFNIMENNIKAIEKYINEEKNIIIEDKHKLQTIISDISHQVKTPISNIKMINEILLSRRLDEKQSRDFLESMDKEIHKLDFLMQSMISISILETGIIKFNTRELPIYDTILSSLNSAMSFINEKEIDIKVICDENILVKHDPKWTTEAIYNVINNAAKFTPLKGNIVVKVVQEQFYTSILIKDNGPGISNESLKSIFNKFYSKNNENGSGIGLHLTEKIIKGQNGYINVKSVVNQGTEFVLYLPNK